MVPQVCVDGFWETDAREFANFVFFCEGPNKAQKVNPSSEGFGDVSCNFLSGPKKKAKNVPCAVLTCPLLVQGVQGYLWVGRRWWWVAGGAPPLSWYDGRLN